MKIIEKIEIKNFRSFLGTTKLDEAIVYDVNELNIFSGANDSGKSNVLRALNLFFNGEIDSTHPFNFATEFTMLKKDLTQKVIEIKIYFQVSKKRRFSISKFYNREGYRNFEYVFEESGEELRIDSRPEINAERYGPKGDEKSVNYKPAHHIYKQEKGKRTYVTQFLKSISFSYVPAIRDERFFAHLYGKIILQIKQNEEKEIDELSALERKIKDWEKTLKKDNKTDSDELKNNLQDEKWRINELTKIGKTKLSSSILQTSIVDLEKKINEFSETLFSSASSSLQLDSGFKIGNNLKEFFESFDIGTGNNREISLKLRGDGIQAKFIPEMLDFLNSIQKTKRHFIWGFEEPENSAEYKNQQELASKFKWKFLTDKQIFLTTHSEEFLSLYDGIDVDKDKRKANLYHVKKVSSKEFNDFFSVITLFDVETQTFGFATVKSDLEIDLGSSLIRAKYSKELKRKEDEFLEEKKKLEQEKVNLENENKKSEDKLKQEVLRLLNLCPDKVFICEDENGVKIWISFFEKLNIENVSIIPSRGCTVNKIEDWIYENKKRILNYKPKVFKSLDRDGYLQSQIDFIENKFKEKNERILGKGNYEIKFLPVNELENFAILADEYFTNELIKENIIGLEDKFTLTAKSNLKLNNNKFSDETDIFNTHKNQLLEREMEREAKTNIRKFFPGKDIKTLKPNYNVENYIKNLKFQDYPKELVEYLDIIKKFFQ